MKVIKRDGTKADFDINKIISAVEKSFAACNREKPKDLKILLKSIFSRIEDKDGEIGIEEIQNRVEDLLMHREYYDVAKKYILYRAERKKIRDFANSKIDFINKYKQSNNTANATIDDNSNVVNKNIAVLNSEIHKEENQYINFKIWENKLKQLFPDFDYKQMTKDFNTICYPHDSNSQVGMPYCVAITMYPFLNDGIRKIGGLSASPKNIDSFCGMFVNLVFAVASQFKGAVATPSMLLIMDYFLRKEYGEDYYLNGDSVITAGIVNRTQTVEGQIHQYFQQICYSLIQPSGSRGNQACFWNLSIFDKPFFDTMYEVFTFPDGTPAKWESFNWLQKNFMHWLNQERLKCVLTFPVVSACLIYQDGKFLDEEMYEFICKEYSEGNSFFTYISDSADSLSSCCRLSSKMEKPQFNFTNGQLSEMTGSKNVITLNLNRITQDYFKTVDTDYSGTTGILYKNITEDDMNGFKDYIINILKRVYKYQVAYNECLKDLLEANMLTVYKAGFIHMNKQYLTTGINGLNQAAEFLGIECNNNEIYKKFCNLIFTTIKDFNTAHNTTELKFNTELTPCESAAIKLYNRDKKDGYWTPEDTNLYASYVFKPNDKEISLLDKFVLHGKYFIGDCLDGGSACHVNLENHPDESQCRLLLNHAAKVGCKYFTFNVPNSECEDCGFITKVPISECPKCGSKNISLWDRVIGYLTKIKNWSEGRQIEQKTRVYHG